MAERGEFDLIRAVAARVVRASGNVPSATDSDTGVGRVDAVRVGIGDDCAVASLPPGCELLLTTDVLVEDRHFRLGGDAGQPALDPQALGWKALAVSISDIAAMGGRALHALVSVVLPGERTGEFADALLEGLAACAEQHGVALVGGDTSGSPGPIVVNVAMTGCAPLGKAVLRDGSRVGDAVCVTGALGGSLLGRHLHPIPRQDAALRLVQGRDVHAMIDVSDGLSSDLGHLLDAAGVGAVVFADRIPVHADAEAAAREDGVSALDHALHDGEDFELLFTVDPSDAVELECSGLAGTPVTRIGTITEERGLALLDTEGAPESARPLERRGHDHFPRA